VLRSYLSSGIGITQSEKAALVLGPKDSIHLGRS
jgi:hypothetical protein